MIKKLILITKTKTVIWHRLLVNSMVNMKAHAYDCLYTHTYHIQTLFQLVSMNICWYIRSCEYNDVLFLVFVYHFECLRVYYLINPIAIHTVRTRTHKWNTYGYRMKQNVSIIPFVTYKYLSTPSVVNHLKMDFY